MATDLPQSEFDAFYDFLGRLRRFSPGPVSPEESVEKFRAYQDELERFVAETQVAVDQAGRGEAKPLDADALMQRVCQRDSSLE